MRAYVWMIVLCCAWRAGDAKNAHLAAMDGAADRLRLFRADLLDYGSVLAAIAGCDGVFHVASPVPSTYPVGDPEAPHLSSPFQLLPSFFPRLSHASVQSLLLQVELLAPAVTGTMNVLKACSEAKVKRVVVVSSLSAVMVNPGWPQDEVMDEACWSDVEFCRTTQVTAKASHAPCSSHPLNSRKFDDWHRVFRSCIPRIDCKQLTT